MRFVCPLVVRNATTPHNCSFLHVKNFRILSVRFGTLFNTYNQMKYLLLSLLVSVSIVFGSNEPGKALDEREKSNFYFLILSNSNYFSKGKSWIWCLIARGFSTNTLNKTENAIQSPRRRDHWLRRQMLKDSIYIKTKDQ